MSLSWPSFPERSPVRIAEHRWWPAAFLAAMLPALLGASPAAANPPSDVDLPLQAPGGSRGRVFLGFTVGSLDIVGDGENQRDALPISVDVGMVGGFQTIKLARYSYVARRDDLPFPTREQKLPAHELSAFYRLYLMPDHWAGPMIQFGPTLLLASSRDGGRDWFGGVVLGTGFYAHLSTILSTRFEVSFDRYDTGRFFSHDAVWRRDVAAGLDVVVGVPK